MQDTLEIAGKTYVSSKRLAEKYGYTNDHISRLCRQGKVRGQRISRTWFVDEKDLLSYKNELEHNGWGHGNKNGTGRKRSDVSTSQPASPVFSEEGGEQKEETPSVSTGSEKEAKGTSHESSASIFGQQALPSYDNNSEQYASFSYEPEHVAELFPEIPTAPDQYASEAEVENERKQSSYTPHETSPQSRPSVSHISKSAGIQASDTLVRKDEKQKQKETHPLFRHVALPVRNAVLFFSLLSLFSTGLVINDPFHRDALYAQTARAIFGAEEMFTSGARLASGEYDDALSNVASVQSSMKNILDVSSLSVYYAVQDAKEKTRDTILSWLGIPDGLQYSETDTFTFGGLYNIDESTPQPQREIIRETKVVERVIEKQTQGPLLAHTTGVSEEELTTRLQEVENALRQKIFEVRGNIPESNTIRTTQRIISQSQRIDNLSGVTITNATVDGVSGLSDSDIPDGITASNYLPLAGGTLTGGLTGTSAIFSGALTTQGSVTFYQEPQFPTFNATSTTGTSNIAGNLKIDGDLTVSGAQSFSGALTLPYFVATSTATSSSVTYRLGVGTTSPYTTLSVSGDAVVTDNLTASNFTATSSTASTFPYASSTAITTTSLFPTDIYSFTLQGDLLANGQNITGIGTATGTDLEFTNATITNATSTNFFTSIFDATTGTITNFIATNSTTTNATSTNLFTTNFTAGGALTINGAGKDMLLSTDSSGNVVATSTPTLSHLFATSTSATSTFAGGINVGSGNFLVDFNSGNTTVGNLLTVSGTGTSTIEDNLHVLNTLQVGSGSSYLTTDSLTTGSGTFSSTLDVTGAATFSNTLDVTGEVTLSNTTGGILETDSSGTVSATSTINDFFVSDALTISSSGSVADGALSPNVSLLGQTIESSEITDGTVANVDLANSSVSYGGVSVSLGSSDATPAFDLTDATSLPIVSGTTGTLTVARGGTGQTTHTAGQLLYGSGTNALQSVATTTATIGSGLSYSGTFGALVGGAAGTLTLDADVSDLNDVDTTGAASSNILMFNGTNWVTQATSTEMLQDLVTLAGEDYLSLNGQEITANALNPDNLAATDFGDWTCNGTTCSLDTDTVSDNEIDYSTVTLNDFTNDANFSTFAWTPTDYGVSTSTTLGFLNGFLSTASSTFTSDVHFPSGVWESGGNVGIGETSPGKQLHVKGSLDYSGILVENTGTGGNDWGVFATAGNSAAGQGKFTINEYGVGDRLTIQSGGNVGIGTTSPGSILNIRSDNPVLTITDSRSASFTVGDSMGSIDFVSEDNSSGISGTTRGSITSVAENTFGSANGLAFSTYGLGEGNIERLRIDNAGNVGIGTTSPDYPLDVNGDFRVGEQGSTNALFVDATNRRLGIRTTSPSGLLDVEGTAGSFEIDSSGVRAQFTRNSANYIQLSGGTSASLRFEGSSGGDYIMTLEETGNVGIGETSPGSKLSVSGGGTFGSGYDTTAAPTNGLAIEGNVGIGTTSPFSKLSVSGDIYADGDLTVSGLTATTSISAPYFTATDSSATSTFAGGINVASGGLVYDHQTGNVGIGTESAANQLEIRESIDNSGTSINDYSGGLMVTNSGNNADAFAAIKFGGWGAGEDGTFIRSVSRGNQETDLQLGEYETGGESTHLSILGSNGNVGIGTTSPGARLEVFADDRNNTLLLRGGTTGNDQPGIYLERNAGDKWNIFNRSNGDGLTFFEETSGSDGHRLFLQEGGNVGIGTTGPGEKLEVAGNVKLDSRGRHFAIGGERVVQLDNSNNFVLGTADASDKVLIKAGGSERVRIQSNGNVGIGTTTPEDELHVSAEGNTVIRVSSEDPNGSGTQSGLNISNNVAVTPFDWRLYADGTADSGRFTIRDDVNGVDALTVLPSSGNVGIGTTSPSELLTLGDGNFELNRDGATNWPYILFKNNGNEIGRIETQTGANRIRIDIGGTDVASFLSNRTDINDLYYNDNGATTGRWRIGLENINPDQPGFLLHNTDAAAGTSGALETYFGGQTGGADTDGYYSLSFIDGSGSINEYLRLDNSGNVGIGTTSPWGKLSVTGGGTGTGQAFNVADSNDSPLFSVLNNGNVGIGTAAPGAKLDITGNVRITNSSGSNPAIWLESDPSNDLHKIYLAGSGYGGDVLQIGRDAGDHDVAIQGNVGIGTTSPFSKLSVAGDTYLGGNLTATGTVQFTAITDGLLFSDSSGNVTATSSLAASNIEDVFLRNDQDDTTTGELTAANFVSTDDTATTTLAGGLQVDTTGLVYDHQTGNVGIGTESPGYTLEVAGSIKTQTSVDTGIFLGATGVNEPKVGFRANDSSERFRIHMQDVNGTTERLAFIKTLGGESEVLSILESGNVGIGTTSPDQLLHLESTNPLFRITDSQTSEGVDIRQDGNETQFRSVGANQLIMSFDSSSNPGTISLRPTGGNVGIGTTSPDNQLHVYGSSQNKALFESTGSTRSNITIKDTNGTGVFGVESGDLYLGIGAALSKANSEFVIDSSGNVGIGETSPGSKLSVSDGGVDNSATDPADYTGGLYVQGGEATAGTYAQIGLGLSQNADSWYLQSIWNANEDVDLAFVRDFSTGDDLEAMRITKDGNVGIGTTSPFSKLSVAGDIYADGDLTVSGLTATTSISAPYFTATDSSATSTFAGGFNVASGGLVYDHQTGNVGIGTTNISGSNTVVEIEDNDSGITPNAASRLTVDNSGNNGITIGSGNSNAGTLFFGDPDSGSLGRVVYDHADDSISLWTVNNERLTVDNNGNVGIGTTSPDNLLHSYTEGADATGKFERAGLDSYIQMQHLGGNAEILFDINNGINQYTIGIDDGASNNPFKISYSNELGTNDLVTVDNDGNVGIGTTNPGSRLQIGDNTADTSNQLILGEFDSSAEGNLPVIQQKNITGSEQSIALGARSTSGNIGFYTGNNTALGSGSNALRMIINKSGNVGIGTTSPFSKLSVSGDIYADGDLTVSGLTATTSISAPYFTATDASATSTFAGGLTVDTLDFVVDPDAGRVGIGTANPDSALHVSGNSDQGANEPSLIINDEDNSSGSQRPRIEFRGNGSLLGRLGFNDNAGFQVFDSGGNPDVTVDTDGNVGIGTTTPGFKLTVDGGGVAGITGNGSSFYSNTNWSLLGYDSTNGKGVGIGYRPDDNGNAIQGLSGTGNGDLVLNPYAGNVGIGTTSPYAKLSVAGDAVVADNVTSSYFTATSTNATSTFAGGFSVAGGKIQHDYGSGVTSIEKLELGNLSFDDDAGQISWIDLPITSNAPSGRIQSYTAQIDTNPVLTIYGEADGSGGAQNLRVGIGSTTPNAQLTIEGDAGQSFDLFSVASSTGSQFFTVTSGGNIGVGTSSPYATLSVVGDAVITGDLTFNNLTASGTPTFSGLGTNMLTAINNAGQLTATSTPTAAAYYATSTNATSTFAGGFNVSSGGLVYDHQTGNVGIGTESPEQSLHVDGGVVTNTLAMWASTNDSPTGGGAVIIENNLSSRPGIVLQTDSGDKLLWADGGRLGVGTLNPDNALTVSGDANITGNVGIGTTSPATSLDVSSDDAITKLGLENTNGLDSRWELWSGDAIAGTGNAFSIYGGSVGAEENRLTIENNGNVGIGTTSPSSLLTVDASGSVQFSGLTNCDTIDTDGSGVLSCGTDDAGSSGSSFAWDTRDYGVATTTTLGFEGGFLSTASSTFTANVNFDSTITIGGDSINEFAGTGLTVSGNALTADLGTSIANGEIDADTIDWDSIADTMTLDAATEVQQGGNNFAFTGGNVGVGTSSPTSRLSVAGDTWLDSQIINFASSSASTLTVNYKSAATSTIPDSENYAWSIATSTSALPIFSIDTSGSGGSGQATTTIRGGVSIDEGRFQHDYGAGVTSIEKLNLGPQSFDDNAGKVSWIDLPITSSAATGTAMAYSSQIDSKEIFTVYGQATGEVDSTVENIRVLVGTSTDTILGSSNIPDYSLLVTNGALCVDNGAGENCDDSALSRGQIYSESTAVGEVDVAENYPTKDASLGKGELVMFDSENEVFVKRYDRTQMDTDGASSTEQTRIDTDIRDAFAGVVSSAPGVLLGGFGKDDFAGETQVPVALTGRVPVLVNGEGGAIKVGDRISFSSVPGIGTRATTSGITVGVALESFEAASSTATSTVMTYVDSEYYFAPSQFAIDREGNVAFGTSTDPSYRVKVDGDVAATGFVNISASSTKRDIKEVSKEEKEGMLEKLRGMFVATYHYNREEYCNEDTNSKIQDTNNNQSTSTQISKRDDCNGKRLGLIAEEAPEEVLSGDGKGVDLYKFITFVTGAVQALAEKVSGFAKEIISDKVVANTELCVGETCITESELKDLLAMRNGQASTTASGTGSSSSGEVSGTPVITINGNNPAYVEVGATYNDLGASVTDDKDENLGIKASVNGEDVGDQSNVEVDTSTTSEHTIEYRVTDNDGNTTTKTRTVFVEDTSNKIQDTNNTQDTNEESTNTNDGEANEASEADEANKADETAPEITLEGSTNIELTVGDSYEELGYSATDDTDGDITSDVVVGGDTVDTSTAGTYTVTYNVADAAGNAADEKVRTITVVESEPEPEPAPEEEETASSTPQSNL